jgi:proteasome lid subunit RPN8/RPN11
MKPNTSSRPQPRPRNRRRLHRRQLSRRQPLLRPQRRRSHSHRPPLRLTPYAWAKLLALRDLGETEVGLFGVSRAEDLLLVEDLHLVRQQCSAITVQFDDASVADYFDNQVDAGRTPEEFARIWIHTHPGDSPFPSSTDEETFARCFGGAEWAIMFILARGGQTYARLRLNSGPVRELVLPVEIDFGAEFPAAEFGSWRDEYDRNVSCHPVWADRQRTASASLASPFDDWPVGEGDPRFVAIENNFHWPPDPILDIPGAFCDA